MKKPSDKNYIVAVSLAFIFGVIGIHHFYLERWLEGLFDFGLFVLTVYFFLNGQIGLAIFALIIDSLHTLAVTIMLLIGEFKDGKGKYVCYPGQKLN
ncbi:MAG: NINE protein [Maricaulaceae bacterium]